MSGKWYKTGFQDALDGIYDPPMWPGNRDHNNYCDGHSDGERRLDIDAAREAYEELKAETGQ